MGRQTWIAAVPGRPSVPAVIVTQPYARAETVVGKMERGLSLGNWLRLEIIAALEWAFYYPGRAKLIGCRRPAGLGLEGIERACARH